VTEGRNDHAPAPACAWAERALREPIAAGIQRRTEEVGRLLPEVYLHRLAQGDFDLALRGLLGDGAPLSRPLGLTSLPRRGWVLLKLA
jgi:hypothetical protein